MRFLQFHALDTPDRKTLTWRVCSAANEQQLGEIKWHSHWRRYAFFPAIGTLFDASCLRELADFLDDEMRKRRET